MKKERAHIVVTVMGREGFALEGFIMTEAEGTKMHERKNERNGWFIRTTNRMMRTL